MAQNERLTVCYKGKEIGFLSRKDGAIYFSYSSWWLKNGFSISPRSLPLEEKAFRAPGFHFDGLFGVFADSLPDGWGTRLAIRLLAKRGISYERLSPLEKLAYVGADGLGALSYVPSHALKNDDWSGEYESLALAAMEFCEKEGSPDLDVLFAKGGSSGGARPKAHLRIGGEEWIVKFREKKDPRSIGRMEYEYALAAKECGIPVPECRLLPSSTCDGYFASKRFDRIGGRRVHVISLGGLLETPHYVPNLDYVTFLQATAFISKSMEEMLKAYRLACFNILAHNRDDHSKNFSFLYDEAKGSYILAPAYDLTYTPSILEHEMSCCGSGNPTESDLLALAQKTGIPYQKAREILNQVKQVVQARLGGWIKD